MEEILASIRRIIADDGEAAKQDGPAATAKPEGAPAAAKPVELESDDDVLDLAEIHHYEAPPLSTAPAASLADLDIELPDIAFQDAPAPSEPEPEPSPPVPEPPRAVEPRPVEPPPAPVPAVEVPPSLPHTEHVAMEREPLVSSQTTASVSAAFNILSHTILTQNARTLEDLVGEMLKPMLKVWLDDNLPPLVERLVRAEIERVARGSR